MYGQLYAGLRPSLAWEVEVCVKRMIYVNCARGYGGGGSPGSLIGWVSALHMSPLVDFRKVGQGGWLAELQTALAMGMQRSGTVKGAPWSQREWTGI